MEGWFLLRCILLFRCKLGGFLVIPLYDGVLHRPYQDNHVQFFTIQFYHHLRECHLLFYQQGSRNCVFLLLCGDVSPNLGPIRYPCSVCKKPVKSNQKALLCDNCNEWSHAGCASIGSSLYRELSERSDFFMVLSAVPLGHAPLF